MMVKAGILQAIDVLETFCDSCAMEKSTRQQFKDSTSITRAVGDLVVSDLKFYPGNTFDGKSCFLSIIDVHTGYAFLYLLNSKSEAADKIKEYLALFKNRFGKDIKTFRSDNGTEHVNNKLKETFKRLGITQQTTVRYCPQSGGIHERFNRTIDEKLMSVKHQTKFPNMLWGEIAMAINFIHNKTPSRKHNGKSPYENWFGEVPKIDMLRVIGSDAFAHIPSEIRKGN